jgi:hypothetical protein
MTEQQFPGSRWWKFDFHTHTPASSDYKPEEKHISHRDWLLAHMRQGIDAVVVTDHNSADWINDLQTELKKLAEEKPQGWHALVVFPGVEITTSERAHLLGVFSPDTTAREIDGLLHAPDVSWDKPNSNSGNAEWCMSGINMSAMIDRIHAKGGLAIPAHVDTKNGLLASQTKDGFQIDNPRSDLVSRVLAAADALDVRDVSDPVLQSYATEIALKAKVDGSDTPHCLANVGSRWVWLKMAKPTFEGLKLALAEPALSVRRSDKSTEPLPKQWIQSLQIQGLAKRHRPLTIDFNPWLNTVIGGRGSGKSSLVECLRLALGREQEAEQQLSREHEVSKAIAQFAESMVLDKTQLSAAVQGAGQLGGINRYDWSKNEKRVMRPDGQVTESWVDTGIEHNKVLDDFPVRLFSQKQIHALANQPGGLLGYLDSSRTDDQWLKIYQRKKNFNADPKSAQQAAHSQAMKRGGSFVIASTSSSVNRFEDTRDAVRNKESELSAWAQVKSDLAQVQESLNTYAKQGVSDKVEELQRLRAEKRAIEDFSQGVSCEINSIQNAFLPLQLKDDWSVNLPETASTSANEVAQRWQKAFATMQATWGAVQTHMLLLQTQAQQLTSDAAYLQWSTEQQAQEAQCRSELENVKAMLGGQLQQVGVLHQQKEDLEKQNQLFELKAKELEVAKVLREQRYQEMVSARQAITQARQDFVNAVIRNAPEETLQITVHPVAQYDDVSLNELRKLLGLNTADYANSFLGDLENEGSKGIVPTLAQQPERLDELKKGIEAFVVGEVEQAQKILEIDISGARIRAALKALTPRQLDELWTWFPEDKVEIKFRQAQKDNWQDISTGSAGQKTGALLSFIVNEGEEPLILDQPEDDLDNENVYKLVVEQLRQTKSRRQVIVVTHNANIVVNGDAELVIPMAFRGGQIQADTAGGLQDASIRQKICDVMEGGEKAFKNRYERVLKHKLSKG